MARFQVRIVNFVTKVGYKKNFDIKAEARAFVDEYVANCKDPLFAFTYKIKLQGIWPI
jgi:hypothetical protein